MKVLSVVGARPQFIKAVVVSKKLRQKGINEILVHTGQHYDFNVSDVFFKELNLPKPNYYLGVGSGLHGEQTGKMLIEIEKVLLKEKADLVIVYGDTNSTLAGALAVSKLRIPVAHVEAGLRSYNKNMPEEINRVLTDHISDILFCSSKVAVENLKKEGITKNVYLVGYVMLDIALVDINEVLKKYNLEYKNFILVTIHRAENTDNLENLKNIWEALVEIAQNNIKIFFPIHPRTKKALKENKLLGNNIPNNLILSEPISYKEMVALEQSAKLIITDSGGVQKEGPFFGTPCIILRNETEWTEIIDIGFNKLVGTKKENIVKTSLKIFNEEKIYAPVREFYGDGRAGEKNSKGYCFKL